MTNCPRHNNGAKDAKCIDCQGITPHLKELTDYNQQFRRTIVADITKLIEGMKKPTQIYKTETGAFVQTDMLIPGQNDEANFAYNQVLEDVLSAISEFYPFTTPLEEPPKTMSVEDLERAIEKGRELGLGRHLEDNNKDT